ncbi:MAG TPA: hypothetical protein VES95_13040 [Dermatophilaceae bacterium]|nr:hypothetical protein [Dermatophilaceae bacterium]
MATPAEPSPGGSASPSVPSAADVAKAKAAADAAAKEVAEITAKVAGAQAQLEKLQRAVADAVTGHERAEQQLADAEAAVRKATADVAAARRAREQAERALSGEAALMYMQGGDLQHMPTLLLSPANTMSDLTVVLDQSSRRVQDSLETATSAAVRAAATERVLVSVRADRDTAAAAAATKRAAAEKEAATAGAEAARLGQQQEALTARLAELNQGAEDLAGQREAAARLSRDLLGRQAAGGAGPRAAQEIARSKMASHGWDGAEFPCLVALWTAESGWSWSATNPSSGAYGIPQSLPGWKMASAGSDWLTNPATQITWGMGYIKDRYGSPCNAYDAFQSRSPHWY